MSKISDRISEKLLGLETVRTLGLYQPFASLMLPPHFKVETRWVQKGRKPPFPRGWYLIYSTGKEYKDHEVKNISGSYYNQLKDQMKAEANGFGLTNQVIHQPRTDNLRGYAIGIGRLVKLEPYSVMRAAETFVDVKLDLIKIHDIKDSSGEIIRSFLELDGYVLWNLVFEDMERIEPFPFKGKQGVGILSFEDRKKIKIYQ